MKRVHVVAGIVWNPQGDQVFIAKRPDHVHQGGLWEFPGGKVDTGESSADALKRELHEELGIEVLASSHFQTLSYDYPDKQIQLEFWQVSGFTGIATGAEGQETRWVGLDELSLYAFPAANQPVVDALLSAHSQASCKPKD
jgi:8-oxo-dGTP diphosphatase